MLSAQDIPPRRRGEGHRPALGQRPLPAGTLYLLYGWSGSALGGDPHARGP